MLISIYAGVLLLTVAVLILGASFVVGFQRLLRHVQKIPQNSDRPNLLHGATLWLSGSFFIVAFIVIGFFWDILTGH